MNFLNTLSLGQWLLLAAIPIAILSLYFLKLRRKPVEVPSTLLWKKALEDIHVNSIWQRLRNNLLLWLQLIVLALVIIACLRPGWQGTRTVGERRIYMIDHSASMGATDLGEPRLLKAKENVKALISEMAGNDVGMIVAFSDRSEVRHGFTSDKKKLLAAVDGIEITYRTTDVLEALRTVAGLATIAGGTTEGGESDEASKPTPTAVYLMSDGGFTTPPDTDLGSLTIEYIPVGDAATGNLAIASFAVQRSEEKPDNLEAFARVANFGDAKVTCTATLFVDGDLVDASQVTVEAGKETGLLFDLQQLETGELKLELEHEDPFPIDNVAYASVRPSKLISVLFITPGNSALDAALHTERCKKISQVQVEPPSYLTSEAYTKGVASGSFDLIIYDQCAPAVMPNASTLFIGTPPPDSIASAGRTPDAGEGELVKEGESPVVGIEGARWQVGPNIGPLFVIDVERSNPITEYLEMASVNIVDGQTVIPPLGGRVLMTTNHGPVFAIAPRGPFLDAVLGFPLVRSGDSGNAINTDWGIARSFPVFVYAAVEHLGGGIVGASAPSVVPGAPVGLTLATGEKTFRVIGPDGLEKRVEKGEGSHATFTNTEAPGVYRIYTVEGDALVDSFCVNLFSDRESNLKVPEAIQLGTDRIAASATIIQRRNEIWRWLLGGALALLALEWLIFNRRVFA